MELVIFGERCQTEITEANQKGKFKKITQITDAQQCIDYFNKLHEAILLVFSDHRQCFSAGEATKFSNIVNKNCVGVIVGNSTQMREWSHFPNKINLVTLTIIQAIAELLATLTPKEAIQEI